MEMLQSKSSLGARWQHREPGSTACPAKQCCSLLLTVGVLYRRMMMMAELHSQNVGCPSVSDAQRAKCTLAPCPVQGKGCPARVNPPSLGAGPL